MAMTYTSEEKYSKETLTILAAESRSVNAIVKKIGTPRAGGSAHRWVKKKLTDFQIDTSHFTGRGWAKGLNGETTPQLRSKSDEEVFCLESKVTGTKLRKRYILKNSLYQCSCCNLTEWLGQPIKLHLDHINGVPNDNRL
jgi:hypothetical protein